MHQVKDGEISSRPASIRQQDGIAEGLCWATEKVTHKPRFGFKGLLSAGGAQGLVCVENIYLGVMWRGRFFAVAGVFAFIKL